MANLKPQLTEKKDFTELCEYNAWYRQLNGAIHYNESCTGLDST